MEIPVDYAQANFIYGGTNLPHGAQWTLGLNIELSPLSPTEVADELQTQYLSANLDNFHANQTALVGILVKFGPNATGPSGEWSGTITGTGGTLGATPNVSFLVQKNTAFGGRTGRGRLYFPGVPEDAVSGTGALTGLWLTDMQAAFTDFRSKIIAENLVPVLLHGPDSPVSAPLPITSFTVSGTAATQRRRLRP